MRITERLALLVADALARAESSGALPAAGGTEVEIESPQHPERGDFSTNVALKLARTMRMPPIAIAEKVVESLSASPEVAKAWAARPGFVNFALSEGWLRKQVTYVRELGDKFGNADIGVGSTLQVEYVSVNPTGPLHVGHAWGAVIGSGLANILEAVGYEVTREYYFNDSGNQIRVFNETLYARYLQAAGKDAPLPEPAYEGEYLVELAGEILRDEGDRFVDMSHDEAVAALAPIAAERTIALNKEDLERLGARFDVWFTEQSLLDDGQFDQAIRLLEDNGYIADRDGARWFKATRLGEDEDVVVIRSGGGGPTYLGTDIAYHFNKLLVRGFDRVINVWGADHHSHVARMRAVVSALGIDPERLTIIVNQIVSLKRGDKSVRLSKRKGEIVTVRELVEEVGRDACRYIFLSRTPDSQMEFDLDLAVRQSPQNPVYYVQYAHARIASILRIAADRGIDFSDGDVSLLTHTLELALIRKVIELPEVVFVAAERLETTQLPYYAYELARVFQSYYDNKDECRVLSDDPGHMPLSKARLKLVDAARIALARSLSLMGMSAPERM